MEINKSLSDKTTLETLGERLARRRLDLKLTQATTAEQAGVSKRTVERLEAGASVQLSSLIRILRVLDLMNGLEQMAPPAGPRPMDLLQLKGKPRQRAPASNPDENSSTAAWTWNENA
ncbi:MAG: helix-turn-helix domain-containing protein [Gammaproteobacteria bacterium]